MARLTNIILVDPDIRRRAAISHCLANAGSYVEPFESVAELIRHWPTSGIILAQDDGSGICQLMQHVGDTGNWLPLIAFSEQPTPDRIVQAVLDGAIHYVSWPFEENELIRTIEVASSRAASMGNARLRELMARRRIDRLTPREREVLSGIACGLSNRLIGEKLSISPRTVEIHRANMLNKMGAHHTSEAIRIAIEASLVA